MQNLGILGIMRLFSGLWGGLVLILLLPQHGLVRGSGFQDDRTGYAARGEHIHQQRLQSVSYNKSTSEKDLEETSIMGWGES